jgi:hypothetical protein
LRPEVLECVRLGDRDIDPTQVEQIVQVRRNATGDDRQHAHVVAVVKHPAHLFNKGEGRAGAVAGGDTDRPRVDAILHQLFGILA